MERISVQDDRIEVPGIGATERSAAGCQTDADIGVAGRESLSGRAYRQIRDRLLGFALQPGQKLILRPLAQELRLSPTPVREALQRLVSEQALTLDDRGSAMVPVTALREFQEICQMRADLEGRAIERAVCLADDAQIEAIARINVTCMEAYAANDASSLLQDNLRFHRAICDAGHSTLIRHALEGLWIRLGPIYATLGLNRLPSFTEAGHPHGRMLDGMRRRDIAAARSAVQEDADAGYHLFTAGIAL